MTASSRTPSAPHQQSPPTPKNRRPKSRTKSSPIPKQKPPAYSQQAPAQPTQDPIQNPPRLVPFSAPSTPKRSRSTTSIPREPDPKRQKSITGAAAAAVAAAAARDRPRSPTSSRSRQRKKRTGGGAGTGADDATSGSNVITAATSALRRPSPKPRATPRPAALPSLSGIFAIDGAPIPANLKPVVVARRQFGPDIQRLMHAFGEVRFCSRDVLEIVEDAVRDFVVRASEAAYALAREEPGADDSCTIRVRHVAHCLRRDPRAVQRLNEAVSGTTTNGNTVASTVPVTSTVAQGAQGGSECAVAAARSWELMSELGTLSDVLTPRDKLTAMNDMHSLCTWRAGHTFRFAMNSQQFQDLMHCRSVALTRLDTRSRSPKTRASARMGLFREWLGLSAQPFVIPDDSLHALAHVAWEAVGIITQTALLHRYFDDLARGRGDPRVGNWTYGRHLIAAIGYGLGTAISVPLSDIQANVLRQELENYLVGVQSGGNRWRGYSYASSPCLLPQHIKEALRRLYRAPDTTLGFAQSSLVSFCK